MTVQGKYVDSGLSLRMSLQDALYDCLILLPTTVPFSTIICKLYDWYNEKCQRPLPHVLTFCAPLLGTGHWILVTFP